MKTWKWLPAVTATLLAGAVFALSDVASATGCILNEPWNDVVNTLKIRECADGSASGFAKFLSVDPVIFFKKYRMNANLKANSAPAPNLAKTELFTQNGRPASLAVQDTNPSAAVFKQQDLQLDIGITLHVFQFSSGDNTGT